MSDKGNPKRGPDEATVYQIRIQGHLARQWAGWLGDVTITLEDNGETLLTCPVVDQAELYGLLRRVRDLGVPLISVIRLAPGQEAESDVTQ